MYQALLYLKTNPPVCLFTHSKGIKIGPSYPELRGVSKFPLAMKHPVGSPALIPALPATDGEVLLPGVRVHVAGGGDEAEPAARAGLHPRGPQLGDGRKAAAEPLLAQGGKFDSSIQHGESYRVTHHLGSSIC